MDSSKPLPPPAILTEFISPMVTLLSLSAGRDKICRVFQYFARFILPFIKDDKSLKKTHDFIEKIGGQFGLTRKVLRFGKQVGLARGIYNRWATPKERRQRMALTRSLAEAADAIYFCADHILFFQKIGASKFSPKTIETADWIGNLMWLSAVLFSMISELAELKYLKEDSGKLYADYSMTEEDCKKGEKALEAKRRAAVFTLVQNVFDAPICLHFLNYGVPQTVAGFCGVITSCMSLYDLWKK